MLDLQSCSSCHSLSWIFLAVSRLFSCLRAPVAAAAAAALWPTPRPSRSWCPSWIFCSSPGTRTGLGHRKYCVWSRQSSFSATGLSSVSRPGFWRPPYLRPSPSIFPLLPALCWQPNLRICFSPTPEKILGRRQKTVKKTVAKRNCLIT